MRVSGQLHAPDALPQGKRPGTNCIVGWVGPRADLDGCGKSRPPAGIRSLDRPARSESLYRLSYRGPTSAIIGAKILNISHVAKRMVGFGKCRAGQRHMGNAGM